MESFDIGESLAQELKEKSDELGISKSQFMRDALQMKLNDIEDSLSALDYMIKAEKAINKFKYTLNDYCTKNKELNYWLIPDNTKDRKCTVITCQNENCLSYAVMMNVLRKHLLEDGKWKDKKTYDQFSQKHYDNMKLPGTLQDEEYISIIESWLLDLMGRYNLQ
jgi:predicted DNA-binding protein